ncbi:MAG: hypothetical protein LBP21_05085, partial [Synergistaceae bacterium]|nr:hypothetical protein [Synergistaceae bacterium]
MTTVTDVRQPEMGLNFDKVWAVLQENAKQIRETNEQIKKSSEETDRKLRETAKQIKEAGEETDRRMQKSSE